MTWDVVIGGGGHNGLTAAAYLALAGKRVLVLERLEHVGGAAVSAQAFDGVDARLSRYSYLVSLLPRKVIDDLGLDISLIRRRYSSYTPVGDGGVLVDNGDASTVPGWDAFYERTAALARALFPTVTEPLLTRSEARAAVGDDALWNDFIERPVGSLIAREFDDDTVRGIVLTDALIGTFAPNVDDSLAANKCFLYHVIGNGTGDWDVPVGGMGAVTGELYRAARAAGAQFQTGATVTAISPDGVVTLADGSTVTGETVLANVAPFVLDQLVSGLSSERGTSPRIETAESGSSSRSGASIETQPASTGVSIQPQTAYSTHSKPEGAQVKVNLLLSRLPRLTDATVDPAAAFGGTFHVNESWSQLETAFDTASAGGIPNPLPLEIYCHSLSDPSILSPELRESGAQTITVFGLHVPDRLITPENNDEMRAVLQQAAIDSLNSVLAEPIESLLLTDATGRPTIETKTTLDLEVALNMPGGNIFHGPLSWPFVEDDAVLDTAAQRWGVATAWPRILMCGSGAQRGGAVSGLGGHNAAMALLEDDQ